MKKIVQFTFIVLILGLVSTAFTTETRSEANGSPNEDLSASNSINWMTWQEAVEAQATNPKKIFVDCYTSWCGWCKRMDNSTFKDPQVIKILNESYYPVKFNAEQKESLTWNNHTFKFINQGRRGVHELAYSLLDGKLSYPSYVYLDESFSRITISPGFKQVPQLIDELHYIEGEHYKTQTFANYKKTHHKDKKKH